VTWKGNSRQGADFMENDEANAAWWNSYQQELQQLNEEEKTMAIYASDAGGSDFKPVPADVHDAVCVWMVDLGVQPGGIYKPKHQVYIKWEIPGERIEYEKDGVKHEGPMTIGSFYTVSLSEKATLRGDLEGWRGRPFTADELKQFDITKVVGTPCRLLVEHKTKADGKVVAFVSRVTKAKNKAEPEGDLLLYDPDHADTFDKLPGWLQDKVKQQIKGDEPRENVSGVEPFADDIPFRHRHWLS